VLCLGAACPSATRCATRLGDELLGRATTTSTSVPGSDGISCALVPVNGASTEQSLRQAYVLGRARFVVLPVGFLPVGFLPVGFLPVGPVRERVIDHRPSISSPYAEVALTPTEISPQWPHLSPGAQ
jgi:hypothetical protein